MDATFKLAENSDIDTILTLIQEFYELEKLKFDATTARKALNDLLNNESLGIVWLIQHQGEAIGYFVLTFGYSLEFAGRDALLDEFYVRSSYQGQGIGTKALEYVQEFCHSLGIQVMHLVVERKNANAQKLYRRFGFEKHDRYILSKWL